jgi:hypothetical protein
VEEVKCYRRLQLAIKSSINDVFYCDRFPFLNKEHRIVMNTELVVFFNEFTSAVMIKRASEESLLSLQVRDIETITTRSALHVFSAEVFMVNLFPI